MLRVALLAAAAFVTQARIIAFGVQAGASIQSRPSYADFSGTQPRPVTVSQSVQETTDDPYLLYPDQMQLAWAYQQVDLLNSLQSFMLAPRTPCGHAAKAMGAQQAPRLITSTMNPSVMSYLASSRLSSLPASFDVFAQADEDSVAETFPSEMDADSASLTTAADDSVINAIVSALSGSDRTQLQDESEVLEDIAAAAGDDIRSRQIETAVMAQDNVVPEHFSLMTGSMDTADWTAFDQLAEQSGDIDDALNWSIVDDKGHMNWGVLLFSLLCIACGAVWLGLLRSWCALGTSCLSCPYKKPQAQFLTLSADDMTSPLLAPLQHEGLGGPTGAIKSSDIVAVKNVEVASEHANDGIEYITIAYAPLKGEA